MGHTASESLLRCPGRVGGQAKIQAVKGRAREPRDGSQWLSGQQQWAPGQQGQWLLSRLSVQRTCVPEGFV